MVVGIDREWKWRDVSVFNRYLEDKFEKKRKKKEEDKFDRTCHCNGFG